MTVPWVIFLLIFINSVCPGIAKGNSDKNFELVEQLSRQVDVSY
jgi:hypothetical protein